MRKKKKASCMIQMANAEVKQRRPEAWDFEEREKREARLPERRERRGNSAKGSMNMNRHGGMNESQFIGEDMVLPWNEFTHSFFTFDITVQQTQETG